MPVISALGHLRLEDHEFKVSLGYIVASFSLFVFLIQTVLKPM